MANDARRDVLPIPEGDSGTSVSDDYGPADAAFTCRILWVQLDLGEDADDPDHQISEEERFRIAMARQ